MPSPRPRAPVALGNFGFPGPKRKPAAVIPPRAAELIRLMVYGSTDASVPPMRLNEAAVHMGIQKRTAAHYFRHPAARAEYLRLVRDLREAEQIRNLHTAVEIRDDDSMADSAAGNRARIEACRFIEHRDEPRGGVHVNVGVSVQNMPGYQVRSTSDPALIARVLAQAGSADSIGGDVIDHARAVPEPEPRADDEPPRQSSSPRLHLDPKQLASRFSDAGADLTNT